MRTRYKPVCVRHQRRPDATLDWARAYIAPPARTADELHIQAIVANLLTQVEAGR